MALVGQTGGLRQLKYLVHFQPQALGQHAVSQVTGMLEITQCADEACRDFGQGLG